MPVMRLKRIKVLSLGKVYTVLMAIIGLFTGIYYAVLGISFGVRQGFSGAWLALFNIIITPVYFAIIGFVIGVICALLYNIVAKWVGGIKLEFEK